MSALKKLLLASTLIAIATASSSALAMMQAMDDSSLSNATGQDGITIGVDSALNLSVAVHDLDGINTSLTPGNDYSHAGAFYFDDVSITGSDPSKVDALGFNKAHFGVTLDAGSDGTAATVHIGITLGCAAGVTPGCTTTNNTTFSLGGLQIAQSDRTLNTNGTTSTGSWNLSNLSGDFMDLGSLTIGGGTTAGIELGSEPQGSMFLMNTTIAGGISLSNYNINDVVGGGSFHVGAVSIADSGLAAGAAQTLTTDVAADICGSSSSAAGCSGQEGLVVSLKQLGSASGVDVQMNNISLGGLNNNVPTAGYIGNMSVIGLQMSGTTVAISGH